MQILKIKLPSEKRDNPIADILFYKKPVDSEIHIDVLSKDDVQAMVMKIYTISDSNCVILQSCRHHYWWFHKLSLSVK